MGFLAVVYLARLIVDYREPPEGDFLTRLGAADKKGRERIRNEHPKHSFADHIVDRPLGSRVFWGGWLAIGVLSPLLAGTRSLARHNAARPNDYFVAKLGDTTFVAVRQYSGHIVAIRLDPDSGHFANDYRLVPVDDPHVVWKTMKLQTLTRAPVSQPNGQAPAPDSQPKEPPAPVTKPQGRVTH
jgi:hypothetical protein